MQVRKMWQMKKTTILYDYYVLKITFNQSTANYDRINDNNHRQVFKYMQHMRTELFFFIKKWKKFISKFIHFPIKSTVHSWNTYIFYFVTKSINPISWQIYTCRVHGGVCVCVSVFIHRKLCSRANETFTIAANV